MKEILFSCSGLTVGTPHKVQAEQLYAVIYRGESVALVGNLHAGVRLLSSTFAGSSPAGRESSVSTEQLWPSRRNGGSGNGSFTAMHPAEDSCSRKPAALP